MATNSSLADLAIGAGRADADTGRNVVDIITFIEAPWGLNARLFPVQRVILKCYYGVPLDENIYGFDLNEPIPRKHKNYHPDLCDPDGYYIHRVVIPTDHRRTNMIAMTEADYLRYLYDKGRANIREVLAGMERVELILSIGRRSGKCVTGDTLVFTDKGIKRIDTLGDPNGPEVQPMVVGVAQECGHRAESANFINNGIRQTNRIVSHCGYTIEGTDNHRVKIMNTDGHVVWQYLSDIKVGDVVAINRSADLWSTEYVDIRPYHNNLCDRKEAKKVVFPDVLTEDWGLLLGILVGDGTWVVHDKLAVTVENPESWVHFKDLYTKLFGSYKWGMKEGTANTGHVTFYSRAMRALFESLGFEQHAGRFGKMVPWSIMQSPRSVVCAFLRGLFETDGGVESGGKVVSFCSASHRLAHEVQLLLLNLGIVSRHRKKWNKKYKRFYSIIVIMGLRSRKKFASEVGFMTHKKMDPLVASIAAASREGSDTEGIPHQRVSMQALIQSSPSNHNKPGKGWSRSNLRTVCGNTIKPSNNEQTTYDRMRKVLPVAIALGANPDIIAHMQDLQKMDYFYDIVETVTQHEAPVYDLNVPDNAMFVANGYTNHNSFVASCITAYETYRLISKGDPQNYYGVAATNTIQLIAVATGRDQAGLLYQEVSGHFQNCAFFNPYAANNTQSYARFQTPRDINTYGSYREDPTAKATIKITFAPCIAKSLRGAGNIVIILDECAFFTDDGQSSADEVYKAVVPSSLAYIQKDPKNKQRALAGAKVESKVVSISSPCGREGMFYKLYQSGFKGGKAEETMLCLQAPTWEVNPTADSAFLESEYIKDSRSFFTEYGAEFSDRTRGWLEKRDDLIACVDSDRRPRFRASARVAHFAGVDVALVGDATAIAIGHLEEDQIVLDLVESIKAGEGDYEDRERLDFGEITEWIFDYTKRFYISDGMFDQWAGIPLQQSLEARGLTQFKSVHHTSNLTSQLFQNFKDMLFDRRLSFYNWPIPDGKEDCEYITQLLELQAQYKSRNVTIVEAPKIDGKHDDLADAIVRMVWVASQHVSKRGMIAGANTVNRSPILAGNQRQLTPHDAMLLRRAAMQTGSHESRQVPRQGRDGRVIGSQSTQSVRQSMLSTIGKGGTGRGGGFRR